MKNRIKLKLFLIYLVLFTVLGTSVLGQTQVPKMTPFGRGYLEFLPAGYNPTGSTLYPAIIFLHGSGEKGDGSANDLNTKIVKWGPAKFIKAGSNMCFTVNGKTECFIVLSPQLETTKGTWKGASMQFVQWAAANYKIDPDRLFLTGLSLGGNGTWITPSDPLNSPNYFAAIAPVSAYAQDAEACKVAQLHIPVWAFHGVSDVTVTLTQGQRPITAMINCGANPPPIFTTMPGGHNALVWDHVYSPTHTYYSPNLYEWFLGQKKGIILPSAPIVSAGADKNITLPINLITLNGTASDIDGTITSTVWTQVSGPSTATMETPTAVSCKMSNLVTGTYIFNLKGTNSNNYSTSDQATVIVNPSASNLPPVANAGVDKSITQPTSSVTFNGSGTDSDGTITSYLWTQNSGPNTATLSGATSSTLTTSNLIPGSYSFTFKVTDNGGLSGSDQVIVTVLSAPPNNPPASNAGVDKSITLPTNSVSLTGSATDTDGTISSYLWTQTSGPSASTITPNNLGPTIVSNLIDGVYIFNLKVTDNKGSVGNDQVIVTVLPLPPNAPPLANAGTDISITLPVNNTILNGSGTDSDGSIASYLWSQTSGPNSATFSSNSVSSPQISNLLAGNYLFTLTVTDDKGSQGSDQVLITVLPVPPNQPPISNAGSDFSITLPTNSISLTGTGTDTDGIISSYNWTQQNGPSTATIVTPTQKNTQVNGLVAGVYTFELKVTDDKLATGIDQILITVFPAANLSPIANAGPDQSIALPLNTVTLSGTGSDPDGTIAAYKWDQVSGPSVATFSNSNASVTTANSLTNGIYIFSLTVTDNNGTKASDQVSIIVAPEPPNQPPVANAGPDIILTLPTNSATLNGSGTDADGTVSGYSWILVSGPVQIDVGVLDQPTLSISNLAQGIYVFGLTIYDNKGTTATDEVKVFVNAPNQAPVSNAGLDKVIVLPTNSVTLSGSGTDADGVIISYLWEQANGPNTSIINNSGSASTLVSGLIQGIYTFNFWVTDNDGISDYNQVQVTVNPAPPNSPPLAITGPDLTITLPVNSVSIAGSGTDSDGTISTYLWSQISGPNSAVSTNVNLAAITFSSLIDGLYVFRLTVTDNKGANGQKDINVKVNPKPINIPPIANAGSDGQIILPINTTSLSGSGTDSDGTIASYQWAQTNGPNTAALISPTSANTTVNNLVEGIYVFRLTVTDDKGITGSDEVSITIKPIPANLPPIANGGGNKIITSPATSTSLSGNGTDQDGTVVAFNWQQMSGPSTATTTSLSSKNITLSNLIEGIYVFRLTVTDDKGSTGFDEVNIRLQPIPANQPPTANSGGNKIILLPLNSIIFNGNGSDPDGTISNYNWSQSSGPSTASLTGIGTKDLTANNLVEGTYIFQLTVTDNLGSTGFDEVNVRVNPALPNMLPIANAGVNLSITLPTNSIVITGSANDTDGSISGYTWSQSLGPNTATLNGATTTSLTASNLIEGNYIFRLSAIDNLGASAFDEVLVTVNPLPPNQPPVANAGIDQSIISPPNTTALHGTATDSDGTISTILWSQISGPNSAVLSSSNALDIIVSNLQQGTYIFRLQITDNSGDTNIDEVSVMVRENLSPTAFAGVPVSLILPSTSIQLLGDGTDPDGTIASFAWSQVSGVAATTSAIDQKDLTVSNLQSGSYTFKLTVVDDKGAQGVDSVTITVFNNNTPPLANAGLNITIALPENTALLQGSGSDSDGTIASYLWTQISGPELATLSDASLAIVTISDLLEGIYGFQLTVTDNAGFTATDDIIIKVLSEGVSLKIPKIFSPNGDGINDTWSWANTDMYQECLLTIFNRFGRRVFEKTSYDSSWDGRSQDGQLLEEEAYYYVIKCNGSENITGGVRIIR